MSPINEHDYRQGSYLAAGLPTVPQLCNVNVLTVPQLCNLNVPTVPQLCNANVSQKRQRSANIKCHRSSPSQSRLWDNSVQGKDNPLPSIRITSPEPVRRKTRGLNSSHSKRWISEPRAYSKRCFNEPITGLTQSWKIKEPWDIRPKSSLVVDSSASCVQLDVTMSDVSSKERQERSRHNSWSGRTTSPLAPLLVERRGSVMSVERRGSVMSVSSMWDDWEAELRSLSGPEIITRKPLPDGSDILQQVIGGLRPTHSIRKQ